jgi:hypothetical protein
MPEILTESFCERCGTRYTFESAAPRKTRRLGQIKTLSKGMKNWVMSDDTSLDEAMAAARNDDDRELTSHQLDAFHATFNFCMTCRQYTCGNCWNVAEGRCLTCAPHLGHEILPAPFPDQAGFEPIRLEAEAWPDVDLSVAGGAPNGNGNGNGLHPELTDAWASTGAPDLEEILAIDPAARLAFLSGETPSPTIEPDAARPGAPQTSTGLPPTAAGIFRWPTTDEPAPAAADAVLPEPSAAPSEVVASEPAAIPADEVAASFVPDAAPSADAAPAEPLPPTIDGRANLGANRTADLLKRFRPGQNIDAELAAYEAEADRAAALQDVAATTDSVAALELSADGLAPEPIAAEAVELKPVLADAVAPESVAVEPEPVAAETVAPVPVAAEAVPPEPVSAAPVVAAEPTPPVAPTRAPAPVPVWPAPQATPGEPPREDRIQQPTWQIFAPDATPAVGRPLDGSLPPAVPAQPPFAASADPQWPVHPDQVESPAMALLAKRSNGSPSDGLWAASAQEVLARPASSQMPGATGVQPCSSCGLSLSATARFCRRCGTRQG